MKLAEVIRAELLQLVAERGVVPNCQLTPDVSLVEDLGLDSLAFVELTLRLEGRLELGELPLREWIDTQSMSPGGRYTLGSLLAHLEEYLNDIDSRQSRPISA